MKKVIISSLLVYVVVCILSLILPSSDGYNEIGWKLLVGQIYAIPAFVGSFLFYLLSNKKGNKEQES